MVSTNEGMQIDPSDEQRENAIMPNILTWHPGANVMVRRFVHSQKQDSEMVPTDKGT
jgi:hypothetical protein